MAFTSKLLSVAGIKERLTNVKDVLAIAVNPFSKSSITADIKNPVAKKAVELVANNPYTSAAVVAVPFSGSAKTAITSSVAKLSTSTKVATAGAALVVTPALVTSSRAQEATLNIASAVTPERLAKFGADLGNQIDKPSVQGIKDLVAENKILVGTAAVAAAVIGGTAITKAAVTAGNIMAVNKNTKAIQDMNKSTSTAIQPVSNSAPLTSLPAGNQQAMIPSTNPVPINPVAAPLEAKAMKGTSTTKRKRRKYCKGLNKASVRLNLNVKSTKCGAIIC